MKHVESGSHKILRPLTTFSLAHDLRKVSSNVLHIYWKMQSHGQRKINIAMIGRCRYFGTHVSFTRRDCITVLCIYNTPELNRYSISWMTCETLYKCIWSCRLHYIRIFIPTITCLKLISVVVFVLDYMRWKGYQWHLLSHGCADPSVGMQMEATGVLMDKHISMNDVDPGVQSELCIYIVGQSL